MNKLCTSCKVEKKIENFRHINSKRDGIYIQNICRLCNNLIAKKRRLLNIEKTRYKEREKAKSQRIKYPIRFKFYDTIKKHNRRLNTKDLTLDIIKEIYIKYNNVCIYCGKYGNSIDHVLPLSRGGTNNKDNLVISCISCNSKKGSNYLLNFIWNLEKE